MDKKPQPGDWIYCYSLDYPMKVLGIVNGSDLYCEAVPAPTDNRRTLIKASFEHVHSIIELDTIIAVLENEYHRITGIALD